LKEGWEGSEEPCKVKGRYYNEEVDRLAEFGRAILEEARNILPLFESKRDGMAVFFDFRYVPPPRISKSKNTPGGRRKMSLLGSAFVARPCAEYVVKGSYE
jgi:hypothetical protein